MVLALIYLATLRSRRQTQKRKDERTFYTCKFVAIPELCTSVVIPAKVDPASVWTVRLVPYEE